MPSNPSNSQHYPAGPHPSSERTEPNTARFAHPTPGALSHQAAAPLPSFTATAGEPTPEKKQMNPWLAGGVGVLVGSFVTVMAITLMESASSLAAADLIEDTVAACGDPRGITIADEGKSLLFDTEGEEDLSGASLSDVACVFAGVEVPEHVLDQMSRTTALAGNQNATWGDFEAQWTYHPDRGLDGLIRVAE